MNRAISRFGVALLVLYTAVFAQLQSALNLIFRTDAQRLDTVLQWLRKRIFSFGVIFALSGALGPIIGQNFGAGRMDRVRRSFWDALIFTALVILLVSALLFVLRGPIADAFKAEGLASLQMVSNEEISPVFDATAWATEEAIVNAMVAAETMTGIDGRRVERLPHDGLRAALRKYNRLAQ